MKRSVFRLLAVIAVVGLAVSCGGGGGDDDGDGGAYNFAGQWVWHGIVTQSNVPENPVGDQVLDVLIVVQNGNDVTVTIESMVPYLTMKGTCDPVAKTFNATGTATGPIAGLVVAVQGVGADENSMTGNFQMKRGGRFTNGTWTSTLASRSIKSANYGTGELRNLALKMLQ